MPIHFTPIHLLRYVLKREASQFFVSIAIRNLALGMVLIFEPIYIYIYFGHSLPLTLLFFGSAHGIYGLLAVFGAEVMEKFGPKHAILFSHFLFFGYFLCLLALSYSSLFLLLPLAIILKALGMVLFWPSFHIDFCRFSQKQHQNRAVGKLNAACLAPAIISPLIGGWILSTFNYPVLFVTVLLVLLSSAIPMFLSKEVHVMYTDSYTAAWKRIFKKANRRISIAFVFSHSEWGINVYIWPIFMAVLAISYSSMGGITTFALAMATLFSLYMGRMSDRLINRVRFLNLGSALTSIAWVIKFFVNTPLSAFLANTLYRICRTTASIPFQALLYERASLKGAEMDEFIVYREILVNVSRFFFFIFLAVFFVFVPQVNYAFFIAAVMSLGFMFLGVPPRVFRKLSWWVKK